MNKNKRIFKWGPFWNKVYKPMKFALVALDGECKFEILEDSETGNFFCKPQAVFDLRFVEENGDCNIFSGKTIHYPLRLELISLLVIISA